MRAEQKSARHLSGTVLVVLLLAGLLFAGSRTQPEMSRTEAIGATYSATQLPPVSDATTKGAMERGCDVRILLGALLDMGKKPEENWSGRRWRPEPRCRT